MPPGALAGLCPACLLAQGLETDTDEARGQHRFVPPSIEEVARLFPQLEILGLLGAGGMGAVYKARQPALDRIVALKVLPTAGASGVNFEERFNREARALARLSHPNIVAVYEFGHAGGLHFFLMEFVDGANLRQLEQAARLAPREALQIIPQICDALQYAHDEGVVHRDIKPENVLVDRKGRVKIADFGLAKILGQDTESLRLTAEGQVMGTPHYMAPEQIEKPLTVDHRADIYSLGVVLYEMLTGDLPLGKFAPPSRKYQLDVRFDEVVLRALENDPARRYQHASEVKSRVETIAGTPAAASSAPAGQRLRKGLPLLVVEREGIRKVSWRGVLAVFALTFGILTVAFGLVTSLTGRSVMGWVGVIGWPSLIARLLMAGLFVGWKVRRALKEPIKEEPLRTPLGTVILSPRISRWAPVIRVGLFIVFCIVAWVWFQDRWLVPFLKARFEKMSSTQIAVRDDQTGLLVAKLPGGGSVELIAVGEPDAAPGGWWRPDGTPATNMAIEARTFSASLAPGTRERVMTLRLADLPQRDIDQRTEFSPSVASTFSSGGGVRMGGRLVPGTQAWRVALPEAARTATMRVGLDLEPWKTLGTHDASSQSTSYVRVLEGKNVAVNFLQQAQERDGAPQISVAFGALGRRWDHRVVAVDTNGMEHASAESSFTPIEKSSLWSYRFPNLPAKAVREFRLEVRPVHWVEFRDIALAPRSPVPPPIPARFGPVMERTFSELIDFDTGKTSGYPPAQPGANPLAGIGENLLWMQENGFDAEAGVGELHVVNMEFVALENADWDTLTAPQALERLERGSRFAPRNLRPLKEGQLSSTFVFRTRERGIGLLQLVSFDQSHGKATVRYKLVRSGAEQSDAARVNPTSEPHVAKRDPESGTLVAELPGNGTMELLALADSDPGADAWWRPDGSRLSNSVFRVVGLADNPTSTNARRKDFVFRITGNPPGVDAPVFACEPAINPLFGGEVTENGRKIPGGWALRDTWDPEVRTATLRFGYGLGSWRTVQTYDLRKRTSTQIPGTGDPDWMASIRDVSGTNVGLQVTAEMGPESLAFLDGTDRYLTVSPGSHAWNWRIRIVVVDATGAEKLHDSAESYPIPNSQPWQSMIWKFQFAGLRPGSVKGVRIQVESLYWVEFRNVMLRAR